jgi:hypothetical protein
MDSEQLEFIRVHGVTHCPPGSTFDVSWRSASSSAATERDILNGMRSGSGVRAFGTVNLCECRTRSHTAEPGKGKRRK